MNFLVQTYDGAVKHDFSFTLMESCRYQNWCRKDEEFSIKFTDEEMYPNHIPVGSVEFVLKYIKEYYGLIVKPINIPSELFQEKYLKRNIIYGKKEDIKGIKFVKSTTHIKKFTDIVDTRFNDVPDDNYLISDVVPINSEWRTFVYNGMIVGLQNFAGDFLTFPNVETIKEMIRVYKDCPPAYTLDVAVNNSGTIIIEVHDFFSCGLYGFADHRYLPFMFSRWFNWFLEKNNKI